MDVSLTADKDNLYKADGNLKIGNRTINITSATKVEFGYYLEENDSANSVDVIYHANDTNIITVIIREGDYMGVGTQRNLFRSIFRTIQRSDCLGGFDEKDNCNYNMCFSLIGSGCGRTYTVPAPQ